MDISNKYCAYFGTTRGVFGSTCCKKGESATYELSGNRDSSEITSMQWGRTDNEIIVGQKDSIVKLYDISKCQFTERIVGFDGRGAVVGVSPVDENIIIALKSGHVNIWNKSKNKSFMLNLENDSTLETICHNKIKRNILATGGESNDIKLWDIEMKKCIFKAKSLGHDNLNLPIPTSVRGISFLDSDENLICCCTKEGHVLLYDERAQRRPVCKFLEPKASYTTICSAYKERQCFVGTTKGYLQLLDMKSAKCLKTFKSFAGSVTGIVCDAEASIVATVSLDRHLRIHNIETKELLYKEYLKQSLTKLLIRPIIKEEVEENNKTDTNVEADDEYEEIFNNMEVISDVKKTNIKKRHIEDSIVKTHKKIKKKQKVT